MQIFQLKTALKILEDQVHALCESLIEAPMVCASKPGAFLKGRQAFSLARSIYSNIWVEDDAVDGRETPVVVGAIESSPESIGLAIKVNATKSLLKDLFMELRQGGDGCLSRAGQDKAFRRYLSDIGLGRISLRQTYRHICCLDERPKSIAFSLSTRGKSITRITPLQAISLLERSGMSGTHIDIQMDQLNALAEDYPLAQIQHLAAYYKSNIRHVSGRRETMPVFMPLLFPAGDEPVVLPAALQDVQRNSKIRKDELISPEPLIPSLRIHAYL
jgi:hypothetical protein